MTVRTCPKKIDTELTGIEFKGNKRNITIGGKGREVTEKQLEQINELLKEELI